MRVQKRGLNVLLIIASHCELTSRGGKVFTGYLKIELRQEPYGYEVKLEPISSATK